MQRQIALDLLNSKLQNKNLIKHSLAVEAAMKALAIHFDENESDWALAGLLHDVDYSMVVPDRLSEHSKLGAQICQENGLSEEICQAILAHNEAHGQEPQSKMGKALRSIDPLTGLIVATALVLPSKKIAEVKVETVLNRMDEKSFAKGANRDIIRNGEKLLEMPLVEIIAIVLQAMQEISKEIGL
ncbi:MAG: HD domain-containing protein [Candidatus Paceibacterota bacterium]